MKTIRTHSIDNQTLYSAKDVFKAVGKHWHGARSLERISDKHYRQHDKLKHYLLTDKGVSSLCRKYKVDNPLNTVDFKGADDTKIAQQVKELTSQLKSVKLILANVISATANKQATTDKVDKPTKTASIKDNSTIRAAIRERCIAYANQLAESHGILDKRDIPIFFDLTYNVLYTKFKQEHNFDIKTIANEQNKTGLQVAADYGLLDALYTCAVNALKIKQ